MSASDADLAAGTAWLFARASSTARSTTSSSTRPARCRSPTRSRWGPAARNVVLLGDPQQLAQVIQGTHPAAAAPRCSAPARRRRDDAGRPRLFLERTYRLHPDVCGYISEEFYEGRLEPADVARERTTPLGTGLRYLAGRARRRPAGVAGGGRGRARARSRELRAAGVTDETHGRRAVQRAGERAAPRRCPGVRVGTVDKFQGQEADASSSTRWRARAARTSRAGSSSCSRATGSTSRSRGRSASPTSSLARGCSRSNARTIQQMRLANALCRFVELA